MATDLPRDHRDGQAARSPNEAPEALRRQLSVLGLWLLVVNGMIGAGIFGLPAQAARLVGAYGPVAFVACGLLIVPVILVFAELASRFGSTGGPILYVREAFGAFASFQTGWALYVSRATAFAANLNLLASSAAFLWAPADQGATRVVLLSAICAMLVALNVVGARQAIGTLGALTVLKFLPLIALVAWGAGSIPSAVMALGSEPLPATSSIGAAVLLLLYAFVGFESALVPAGEARDPHRDMPRALLAGLAVATVLYALVQTVCLAVLPSVAATDRPVVDAAAMLFGGAGALVMTAAVVVSVGGNVAGGMFSTPRMTYALAREGLLPAPFAYVHPTFATPVFSIVACGAFVLALAISSSFAWLAAMSVLIRLLMYLGCVAATLRLRRGAAASNASGSVSAAAFRAPGAPTLAAALCVALLTQVSLQSLLATAALLGVGLVLFVAARWSNDR